MDNRPPVTGRPEGPAGLADAQVKWASGLNIIAGLWVLVSPWVLHYATTNPSLRTDDVVVGIIVAILAAIRAFGDPRAAWLSWINLLLGIWLFISAFIWSTPAAGAPFWNNIIMGVIVFVLGALSASAIPGRTFSRPV